MRQEIGFHERLLEKRLSSSYHTQWNQGEAAVKQIAALRLELSKLADSATDVGLDEAKQQVATTRLFNEISKALHIKSELIRAIGYGVLSVLLEVSTLGMISLVQAIKLGALVNDQCLDGAEGESQAFDSEKQALGSEQMKAQLTDDIIKGNISPVLRRIKSANYGLDIDAVRQVLKGLYTAGVLEADKRNSYKLAGYFQNCI
ncbi:hypothetical protein [Oceanicoccus sp. KOV_DT_Chl]|uniref:hypothetical protein n=1 Tax=Oceanicoccus sp. KOV_DT_Chl TaxID=1904639 RepID=UPI00135C9A24|nr:hypothetical protein [Oceanicoccus sp. KOV_DT_Chl]